MTDTESRKEHRHQVERFRLLARETNDPLAWLALDMLSSYKLKPDLRQRRLVVGRTLTVAPPHYRTRRWRGQTSYRRGELLTSVMLLW
jgi:hypothetical protein